MEWIRGCEFLTLNGVNGFEVRLVSFECWRFTVVIGGGRKEFLSLSLI